jgi:hypothetical protein
LGITKLKIGDLVIQRVWSGEDYIGIVIEKGVYAGNKDVKVFWEDGSILTCKSEYTEVINEMD